MIQAVIERCAGVDVHKKFLMVCAMVGPANGEARSETRRFASTVAELERMREWILQEGCTDVMMESTGSYWKPVFNILEGAVKVTLANPHEVKARKGHKTDAKDAWWLAHLLRHGMVTASFIPPRPQRELRDLTRRRRKMLQAATSEKNRVAKVLEDANVKVGSVLSDLFGVSGQKMLEALLEGNVDAEQMAKFAKGKAKKKIPELVASLEKHQMREHHRRMIHFSLTHLRFLEDHIWELDEEIRKKIGEAGYEPQKELLQTVPGVQEATAAVILAEVGPDVTPFKDEKHVSSWAGLCPGNNRSAGKNKGTHTTGGNRFLRGSLTESVWGVAAKKPGHHLRDKFWRIAAKSRPKAVVAVAHDVLKLAYFVLQRGTAYEEKRGTPLTQAQKSRLIRHHIHRLGKLGIVVPVTAPAAAEKKPRARKKSLS